MSSPPLSAKLALWCQQHKITSLDRQFALGLYAMEPHADDLFLLVCVLCSQYLSKQQTCLPLKQINRHALTQLDPLFSQQKLTVEALHQKLNTYQTIGTADSHTPLVLNQERLYLRRYYQYEQELSTMINKLAQKETPLPQAIRPLLDQLFPPTQQKIDWQKVAAITTLMQPLSFITGGPGTGKTTTVAKILLLLQQQQPDALIQLVAPTGKAAARLSESIKQSKVRLRTMHPELQDIMEALPEETKTIHRLLGIRSQQARPVYDQHNPLHLDVLLVDEASMIDVSMMVKLFHALPDHARIILLGDPEQLASVEAGCVLADVCDPLKTSEHQWIMRYSLERIEQLSRLCQQDFTHDIQPSTASLANCICVLTQSHRFKSNSGIGKLAQAVNLNQQDLLTSLWNNPRYPDLAWFDPETELDAFIAQCCQQFAPYLKMMHTSPAQVLAAFQKFRLLSATHLGHLGVADLNYRIEKALTQAGLLRPHTEFYVGRPLLIQSNDYGLNLFNGDMGMILHMPNDKRPMAYFQSDQGEIVSYLPAQLPKHQTCFAMTIHKSQGSEFDTVATVIAPTLLSHHPDFLSRELIYTAITRAKNKHISLATLPSFCHSAQHPTVRASGLQQKLWSHAI